MTSELEFFIHNGRERRNQSSVLQKLIEANVLTDHLLATKEYQTNLRTIQQTNGNKPCRIDIHEETLEMHSIGRTTDERQRLACVLRQLEVDEPKEGVPARFLPIIGTDLKSFIENYRQCIVYCWSHDCPSCKSMRNILESIFDQPVKQTMLLSVYGPDYAAYLYDQFNIIGAPTVLFIKNGNVFSRLEGVHYEEVIMRELSSFKHC